MRFLGVVLVLLFQVHAQAQSLVKVSVSDLPSLSIDENTAGTDSKSAFQSALQIQLDRCLMQSPGDSWNFGGKKITRQKWCQDTVKWFLKELSTAKNLEEVFQKAKHELHWYQSVESAVMFTGYYQPSLKVKRKADLVYRFPIYRMPSNYRYTREQIVAGALKGKGLEIAYASNPVDPYLLEVQGSGTLLIQNEDGSETKILANYAGKNGYAYTSLGRLMREVGIDEQYINLQGIRRYFIDEHPELWLKFSNQNQSFVFFKEATTGPYGAAGVVLTPGHSIAVDTKIFPLGAIALVESERPRSLSPEEQMNWKPFAQFMISQDTGGAIIGAAHVDVYWGSGDYAEWVAGHSKQMGRLFFCLVP